MLQRFFDISASVVQYRIWTSMFKHIEARDCCTIDTHQASADVTT